MAVLVDEKTGRRGVDMEAVEERIPDLFAARGAVEDDIVVEEVGVLGVVVELLNQQFTAPSATREEIDEDELVFLLRPGQSLVEGTAHDRGGLGRRERGEEEQADNRSELSHRGLLVLPDGLLAIISETGRRCNPRRL
jgi:hypothetical protein